MAIEKGSYQYEMLLARLNLLETLGTVSESTLNALREKLGITTKVTAAEVTTTAAAAAAAAAETAAAAAKAEKDITAPTISTVDAKSITNTTATISWMTNEEATSQVDYGKTLTYGSSTTISTKLVTSHSQDLTGLTANTLYYYRVKSKDSTGNLAENTGNTFTTTKAAEKEEAEKVEKVKVTAKEKPTVKEELLITRTKYPKWWDDEGVAKISLTSPGSQFVISARGDYSLYIAAIVLTVSGECDISFTFGSAGLSGNMDFGGSDEPRGMVIAMGNSPAPCGSGSFMVTGTSDEVVSIGGFVSYFLWKKKT